MNLRQDPIRSNRYIVGHLLLQILIRVSGLFTGLITVGLLARGMPHADFGRFTLVLSVVAMAAAFSDLGLASTAVREYSVGRLEPSVVSGALVLARTLTACAAAVIAIAVLAMTLDGSSFRTGALLMVGTLLLAPLTIGPIWAQSQLQMGTQSAFILLQSWAWPITVLGLYSLGASPVGFACGFSATALALAITTWLAFRTQIEISWDGSGAALSQLLRTALPYAVSGLFITAYYRVGGLVVYRSWGPDASADFAAAFRILEALQTIPGALMTVVLPVMSRAFSSDSPDVGARDRRYRLAMRALLVVSLPLAAVTTVRSETITSTLYGRGYVDAGTYLAILIWAYAPICLGYLAMSSAIASGQTRFLTVVTGAVGTANVLMCFLLIPSAGPSAAAWITVATEWVVACSVLAWLTRRWKLPSLTEVLLRPAMLAAACGAVGWLSRDWSLGFSLPLIATTFVAVGLGTKALTLTDLKVLATPGSPS